MNGSNRTALGILRTREWQSTALITCDGAWTVGELLEASQEIGRKLSRHLQGNGSRTFDAGVRILVPSSDPRLYLASLLACLRNGYSVVPWRDIALNGATIARTTSANAIVYFQSSNISDLEIKRTGLPICETASSGDLVMMTSGSTGEPKGVVLSPIQLVLNAMIAGSVMAVDSCDGWAIDIDMALMSATCHTIMAWQYDLPLYYLMSFHADSLRELFRSRKLGYGGSPIQLVRLQEKLSSNEAPRMLVSSGDFLTPSMIDELVSHFPQTLIHKLYGLTELSGRFCCNHHRDLMKNKAAAGKPLPGFRVRIAPGTPLGEFGEIQVKSPLLFRGYLVGDGEFHPHNDDWFGTGDVGEVNEDGFVTIVGRVDDVLKVGGEKVDRQTIETALSELITDREFCVLGVRHPLFGQCVALFITKTVDSEDCLTREQVVRHLRKRLPSRYIPALMFQLNTSLPRLANGKIDSAQLRGRVHEFESLS